MLDKHGDVIYSDLLSVFGVDLLDLVSKDRPLSPRRVIALIENLPPTSRTSTTLAEVPDAYGWGVNEYLLAGLIDSVREGTFTNVQVRSKKKLKPFDPFPTPGAKKKSRKSTNLFVAMAQAQLSKSKEE